MLYGRFIQNQEVDKAVPFHVPLKSLKLKTLASDGIIKCILSRQFPCTLLCQVIYVTSFNKRSGLRNFVNH